MNNNNLQLILDGINFLKGQNQEILKRLDSVETRLDAIEDHMDAIEKRMDKLEVRMDKIEARMDKLERKLDKVETILYKVASEVIDHRFNLGKLVTSEEFTEFKSLNLKFHDDTKFALIRLEHEMKSLIESHKNVVERVAVLEL